ncbi:rod shape-determining protein RodA [Candidatus Dependentiae bacterium]|nr:rod shape-determining protein RodA [Candidatus Dependentiae bacterium]
MIDRRYLRYFDWISFALTIALLAIGLIFVFSATKSHDAVGLSPFFKKQLFGATIGIIIYFFFCFFNLQTLARWGYLGYFGVLALLLYTIIGGWVGMGAKRWISLHVITFQPAELVKISLPLCYAFYFDDISKNQCVQKIPFTFPLALLFITFMLILKQPDLGTALVILFSGLILLWLANIPKKFFLLLFLSCLISAPVLWKNLKPYQQHRVLVLLGHGDSKNERYQIEQSQIAIGSGGVWGKGLLQGTQNRLSFLPEARTDFIFSVLCEEWGFMGALFILLLFSLLFIRLTIVIIGAHEILDQLIGIGLLAPIALSTIINIGMVTGMLPIVGIPLPLLTYGLTNLWVTLASLGILNNIAIRRFLHY